MYVCTYIVAYQGHHLYVSIYLIGYYPPGTIDGIRKEREDKLEAERLAAEQMDFGKEYIIEHCTRHYACCHHFDRHHYYVYEYTSKCACTCIQRTPETIVFLQRRNLKLYRIKNTA